MQIRIAVDAMGGDHAPSVVVDGVVAAARHLDAAIDLVGRTAAVEQALSAHPDWRSLAIGIVEAPDVIEMAEPPASALRRKPRASVKVAADLVARREAAALVSAGHTGAIVLSAHAAFGMVAGVDRPALATTIPTRRHPAVLLDAGANVECRPQHLLQFAVMGSVYARLAHGVAEPRVGLLSIGEEESKGNELTREAHRLLKASSLHFIGNVEGREIYSGVADVVVCDGFTGNIVLKTSEGLVETVEALLGDELQSTFSSQVGYLLSKRAFRRFRRRVDYSEYGGAALLGVGGLVIVGHGRSSARAVRNAVAMAHRFATNDFIAKVEQGIGEIASVKHCVIDDEMCDNSTAPNFQLPTPTQNLGIGDWELGIDGIRSKASRFGVIAFVFPGQGAQKVGMGRTLVESFPEARAAFEEADGAFGDEPPALSTLCFDGPDDRLALTEITQPAMLTASIAACRVLQSRGVHPAFVAGHSLGEYPAHVAAGTFTLGDAVRIVRRRGRYMQEAVPVGEGAMAAIVGAPLDAVRQACNEAADGQVVSPANINGGGQIVIAGHAAAVARASERAKALGARRAIPLSVSAPFHCALMKPAEERLEPELRGLALQEPRIPVVANVDGEPKRTAKEGIEALVRQVSSPVQWEAVVRRLASEGVTTYVEVGPGTVLGGLIKRIHSDARITHFDSPGELDAVMAACSI